MGSGGQMDTLVRAGFGGFADIKTSELGPRGEAGFFQVQEGKGILGRRLGGLVASAGPDGVKC